MRGVSSSLTSVEFRSANDLNNICPYPHYGQELTEPHSPKLVHGIPAGEEMETDSWNTPSNSDEWDDLSVATGHAAPLRLWTKRVPYGRKWLVTLHKGRSPPTKRTQIGMLRPIHQLNPSLERPVSMACCVETLMEMTEPPVESPCDEAFTIVLTEASVGLGSQDVVQIHTGNDDLD